MNMTQLAKDQIHSFIENAVKDCIADGSLKGEFNTNFVIEIPSDKLHGDFATNVALVNAKAFRTAPGKIAQAIVGKLHLEDSLFTKCELAGPGFINFFLSHRWFEDTVDTIVCEGESYGKSNFGNNEKVMVEFVSANPTGPMHLGNARGGALGDCLASVMELAGYDVTREFLVNDAGNQIEKFGLSLYTRYMQILHGEENFPFPEDGYKGDDIRQRAQEFLDLKGSDYGITNEEELKKELVAYALPANIKKMEDDLKKYRIEYDVWFYEHVLHPEAIEQAIEVLKSRDAVYEKDGAIWLKGSFLGEEKDEVLIRQNGNPTYFAADIAYHYDKFAIRKFSRVIDVWGADHHGHVARLKGAMDAIGLDGNKLDIVLMQLVHLSRSGESVRMSKRSGQSVTLSDLLAEIPIDAARFTFNLREPNVHLEFDLDLAVQQSNQNPVYYVQYAHARICSIIRTLKEEGVNVTQFKKETYNKLTETEEIELIRHLATYPDEIINCCKTLDPSKITRYAMDTASLFHKFYNAVRVKGQEEEITNARLALCQATKNVLYNILTALKISAPEKM